MDPTAHLPVELAHSIFSHLPPHDLFTLRRVSKSWNHHLSSTYLELLVNRSLPFASTAKTLPERLQRRRNFASGAPRVYEIAAEGHHDSTKPHTFLGSKQVMFSAGYLGVVRNWDSKLDQYHDGDKHHPVTLEVWNLAAGGRNDVPVTVELPSLFPEEEGKYSKGMVWLFGDVSQAVIRVDKTADKDADSLFRGFAVLDLTTGNILSKWFYTSDSIQAELEPPDHVCCNGREVLAVWKEECGGDLEYIDVHDVASGQSLRWEEIEEEDCDDHHASALSSTGTAYVLATDTATGTLGVRIFCARDPAAPAHFLPVRDIFGADQTASLKNVSLDLVAETLYFKAAYTADPAARWNTRQKTTWSTLLVTLPAATLSPYKPLPTSFPTATVVSKVDNACFHDLTFLHDKMTIWGYSIPGFRPEAPQSLRLAQFEKAECGTTLAHRQVEGITAQKKAEIRSGDDEAIVFYPRGERPRRESYSVPDGERHPALLLDFGGEFEIPERLGKEVSAEKFLELCTPVVEEEEEDEDEDEEGESGQAEGEAGEDEE
ncbi:hypothetical protein BJ508DRAFT_307871 [Ascobolus immersus RN42]|uniref:F-box domain-containing protein n=1 Tax=Ascobolus immersus RN42 TaxID=1160509 RepID=A0A3N4I1V4_ASCIM|nr:hypothetical protein BJ508DRAFT_307871 [Ascobolus immersus RN42]